MSQSERRLAAIMFTDMVGYTALGQRNESLSLALVEEQRKVIRPILTKHNGKEIKTIGDAFLVEFGSALEAVRCAYDIQRAMKELNLSLAEDRRVHLRIGVHLGDVTEEQGDISGDAVNIASRIEGLADDGGVCITRQVFDNVKGKLDVPLSSQGPRSLKNVAEPIEIFKMILPWENEGATAPAGYDRKRVAVLPFANMSPDPNDEYFADGLTEELISTMSRIGGLKVIARTSVMGYKGSTKKISDVAHELSVGTVLEGSVRKSGEKARITVQLIDSRTSEHLWAESYDRDIRDIFAIQSDIARTVAESLKVRLSTQEEATIGGEKKVSPEAYGLYLKGRFFWNERTEESVMKALKYFEEAAALEPELALAHSGIADCYNILADYWWMVPSSAGPLAKEHVLKALQIDPYLAEAHASYGLTLGKSWEFLHAKKELERAIALRPNYSPGLHWYAILLMYLRKVEEAYMFEKKAEEIDPYSRVIGMNLANFEYMLGRFHEAERRHGRLAEENPGFAAIHFWKASDHLLLSQYDEAIKQARTAYEIDPKPIHELNLAFCYAAAGKKEEAEEILDRHLKKRTGNVPPCMIGIVELALGRRDEGFEWLETGIAEKDSTLLELGNDPWFKPFMSDPMWQQIEKRLALPAI